MKGEELRVGTKIRVIEGSPFSAEGDIATICHPYHTFVGAGVADSDGLYWANFRGQGNRIVVKDGIWCVGIPGEHFEIIEEDKAHDSQTENCRNYRRP